MSKYLEREAVLKIVDRRVDLNAKTKPMFQELISLPAADVAPVVHAKWEMTDDWVPKKRCTNCGSRRLMASGETASKMFDAYCPKCGAKMDGGTL